MRMLDIICPTYDNLGQLIPMLASLNASLTTITAKMVRIIIVNNGQAPLRQYISKENKCIEILEPGKNLGWEGGLKLGLKHSDAPFVCFLNDDVRWMTGDLNWVYRVLSTFRNPSVGAVGPSSNFVMGPQNIFTDFNGDMLAVPYLIGFCMFVRREALEKAGGVDDTLPGGDDLDLSIRLRDAGYSLIALRNMFLYHHGQQTGPRVTNGNWDTLDHQSRVHHALIKKHGMLRFWETVVAGWATIKRYQPFEGIAEDREGDLCRSHVQGEKVLELGCGGQKTIASAVGVDIVPNGELTDIGNVSVKSVADLIADVQGPLPAAPNTQDTIIARHVLEHVRDPLAALCHWSTALKIGGRMIVAVPNDMMGDTILMNPDHRHVFTPNSLIMLGTVAGLAEHRTYPNTNGTSFVCVFEKVAEPFSMKKTEAVCA